MIAVHYSSSGVEKGELYISRLIIILFLAPVLEEFLFRGIFLNDFLKLYSKHRALLVSSVLFAIIHLTPIAVISSFIFSMLLGYVFIKTRSIISVILLHFINNLLSILLVNSKIFNSNLIVSIMGSLFGLVLLILGILMLGRKYNKVFVG